MLHNKQRRFIMSKNLGRRKFIKTAGVAALAGLSTKSVYADDGKKLILGISCSPRKGKNTDILVGEALRGAEDTGSDVEFFSVVGKSIAPCDGCWACSANGRCHIEDDMQILYDLMKSADGIVFGTPVFFFDVSAQAKAIIDRSIAFHPFGKPLQGKVGGIVTVSGSTGASDTIKNLSMFFAAHRVLLVNWVAVFAPVEEKPKGMKAANDLGAEIVATLNNGVSFTSEYPPNHITHGTHTH
jgi:multimeric flavodoxin WrbA